MKWLHGRTSGVFAAASNASVAAASGEMAVTVSDGIGWLASSNGDGIVWWSDSDEQTSAPLKLSIATADGILNRVDRVIVEWVIGNYSARPTIRILQGTPAATAAAPALTNSSTVRQISLARIAVAAGTLAITAAMITDERLDSTVCGLVTETLTIDTSTVQSQFETLLAAVEQELNDLNEGAAFEFKRLQFTDTVVPTTAFVADATYEDFPYRASVSLSGVLASMTPEVIFDVADAMSGNLAPVSECYAGGVYIYAAEVPEAATTIPTIICWKAVS